MNRFSFLAASLPALALLLPWASGLLDPPSLRGPTTQARAQAERAAVGALPGGAPRRGEAR